VEAQPQTPSGARKWDEAADAEAANREAALQVGNPPHWVFKGSLEKFRQLCAAAAVGERTGHDRRAPLSGAGGGGLPKKEATRDPRGKTWRHKAALALSGRRKAWGVWVVLF